VNGKQGRPIKLVSCDLNGTLVHQHTMMDMIRCGFPHQPARYHKAKDIFTRQTCGQMSMQAAFAAAAPLTRGLSLRKAIEYALTEMKFIDGFEEFLFALHKDKIPFVINSTGYSVTIQVIKALYDPAKIAGVICNRLVFGWKGDPSYIIEENRQAELVNDYVMRKKTSGVYDDILTVGIVELGIGDEDQKAVLLGNIARKMNIAQNAVAHIGDTMGDSAGIAQVARNGGLGIAFNYNQALKNYIDDLLAHEKIEGRILLIDPKGRDADLRHLLPHLRP
jgi:hypothetical protein